MKIQKTGLTPLTQATNHQPNYSNASIKCQISKRFFSFFQQRLPARLISTNLTQYAESLEYIDAVTKPPHCLVLISTASVEKHIVEMHITQPNKDTELHCIYDSKTKWNPHKTRNMTSHVNYKKLHHCFQVNQYWKQEEDTNADKQYKPRFK